MRNSSQYSQRYTGQYSRQLIRLFKAMTLAGLGLAVAACNQTAPVKDQGKAKEGFVNTEDLLIVDCALPGLVKRLGNMNYVGPRRPVKTTAVDCRIRGGEYVEYDRADYRTALKVWLPQAESGDPEAQNYVGEIFEKGVGKTPDYKSAAMWYAKAAEQDNSRAQVNLAYLYESGLGVPKSATIALNWYRRASGIEGDDLMLSSDAQKAIAESRDKAKKALAKSDMQVRILRDQVAKLRKEASFAAELAEKAIQDAQAKPEVVADSSKAHEELAALTELYQEAEAERETLKKELASLELTYRKLSSGGASESITLEKTDPRKLKDINFGRYFALIIGNQDYLYLDDLRSPLQDTARLEQILQDEYGFSTLRLPNATEKEILNTINNFYEQIGKNDNLLIYYAGHGEISRGGNSQKERGYWLPKEAESENISRWINNAVISDHLDRIKARSVMVIADSCYAGYLGSEKSPFLFGLGGKLSERAIRTGLKRRSRVVISSGGTKPVLDGTNRNHSIFAGALIEVLEKNSGVLKGTNLFSEVSLMLEERGGSVNISQTPEMKPVREAGHEGGAFYFVPSRG